MGGTIPYLGFTSIHSHKFWCSVADFRRFDTPEGLPRQMQQQEYGDDGPFGGPWLGKILQDKGLGKPPHG